MSTTTEAARVDQIRARQQQVADAINSGTVADLDPLLKAGQVTASFEIAIQLAELNRILREEVITTREDRA